MDLRKRLAALDRTTGKSQGSSEKVPGGIGGGSFPETHLTEKLLLNPIQTKAGTVWARHYTDALQFPKGPLPDLSEVLSGAHLANPALEEVFFLDTETTGLAGGTGTLAFLVGCSWFRDGLFHTCQLFLPGPGLEGAVLQEIKRLSANFSVVMTFNGGSFDLPLLRTRALMNRLQNPLGDLVSWDLLMAGRRLWGRMLPNCKQQTLEKYICGINRSGQDIDGSLIPQTWFDFVAHGTTDELEKVLYHNHRDMVGMGELFAKVVTQVSLLERGFETNPSGQWQEFWSLARICEKRKNQDFAAFWIAAALESSELSTQGGEQRGVLFQDAIRILKRSGDWNVVREVIERGVKLGIDEAWIFREAAILFEHRLVDLSRALEYALRVEDSHRVGRLQRKLS